MLAARFVSALSVLLLVLLLSPALQAQDDAKGSKSTSSTKKIRALMISGGCCHDYHNQNRIISQALSERVGPIEWTVLEYGTARDIKPDVYKRADWIKGFDIVIHNECFGGVTDGEFVKGIVAGHVKHNIPAIVIHCSMHSYRNSSAADTWRAFLGVTSVRHERSKHSLKIERTDAGSAQVLSDIEHPWNTPNGELYVIEKVWDTATVLAHAFSKETNKNEPVVWLNQYNGVKIFGITLGHHNETMESENWKKTVANGWKWALHN